MTRVIGRGFAAFSTLLVLALLTAVVTAADQSPRSREQLNEPLLRVAKATAPNAHSHPLDPALDLARNGLKTIQENVRDYTCTVVKRERIDGKLLDYEYMYAKIRNRKVENGKVVSPFSVYMYFLKPTGVKGREVIFVEGKNDNKLVAHEGGASGRFLPTVWLRPTGVLAMRNQRYPITELGIENLIVKLIERGEQDRAAGNKGCQVTFHENAKINGRKCTLLQIEHPQPSADLDFHLAQIFIDDELQVPVRYAAYDFPATPGAKPSVIEEYTYLNIKLNVGLKDKDFDHQNADYNF
jgi:hypothetical protein